MVATTPDNAKAVADPDDKMDEEEENTEPPRLTVNNQIDEDDDDVEPTNLSVLQTIRSM